MPYTICHFMLKLYCGIVALLLIMAETFQEKIQAILSFSVGLKILSTK